MDLPVEQKLAYIWIWNACAEMGRMLYRPQKGNNAADDEAGDDEPRTNSYDECRKSYSSAISRIIQAGDDFSKYKDLVDDVALDNDGVENFSYIIDIEPKPENPNLKKKRRQNVYPMLSFPEFLLQVLYITLDYPDNIETTDFFDVHQLITTFQHLPKEKVSLFYRNLLLYRLLMDFYMPWINDVEEDSNRYLLSSNVKLFRSGIPVHPRVHWCCFTWYLSCILMRSILQEGKLNWCSSWCSIINRNCSTIEVLTNRYAFHGSDDVHLHSNHRCYRIRFSIN